MPRLPTDAGRETAAGCDFSASRASRSNEALAKWPSGIKPTAWRYPKGTRGHGLCKQLGWQELLVPSNWPPALALCLFLGFLHLK